MDHMSIETGATQSSSQGVCDHYGTMTPARATNANRHVGLTFALVLWQQIVKQIAEAVQRFLHLRLRSQVFYDALIVSGERFEVRDKVRIGQMSHIKQKLQIARIAVFMA